MRVTLGWLVPILQTYTRYTGRVVHFGAWDSKLPVIEDTYANTTHTANTSTNNTTTSNPYAPPVDIYKMMVEAEVRTARIRHNIKQAKHRRELEQQFLDPDQHLMSDDEARAIISKYRDMQAKGQTNLLSHAQEIHWRNLMTKAQCALAASHRRRR